MQFNKLNIFEVVLLVVGVAAAILGFQLINQVYKTDNYELSWLMIIAIFSWLTLLVMFILLSLMVDVSKKELNELKVMISLLSENFQKGRRISGKTKALRISGEKKK